MMTQRTPSRQSGLTILEVMVSVAIGMVLILGIGQLFIGGRTSLQLSEVS